MDRSRITPKEFKGALKRVVKTPYLPQKVKDALKESGANQLSWRTATKREFLRTMEDLRDQRLIRTKRTPKQLYEDVLDDRLAAVEGDGGVPLASHKLPPVMKARLFVQFYGRLTGKPGDAKSILQKLNLPFGSDSPPPGAMEPNLTKRQMLLVLNRLRQEGKLTKPNIGEHIGHSYRRLGVYIKEGIEHELSEQELKRYIASAHEDLPEGVQRSIGRPAAGSALTVKGATRTSSAARAGREKNATDATEDTHGTTASELARHAKPYDPKTSVSRSHTEPVHDLPIDE